MTTKNAYRTSRADPSYATEHVVIVVEGEDASNHAASEPDGGRCSVLKHILLARSSFCEEQIRINHSNKVFLAGHSSDIVKTYVDYLYSEQISYKLQPPACHPTHKQMAEQPVCDTCWKEGAQEHYEVLFRLHLLGEKLKDASFCEVVVKEILAQSRKSSCNGVEVAPGPQLLRMAYEKTSPRSKLRNAISDIYARFGMRKEQVVEERSDSMVDRLGIGKSKEKKRKREGGDILEKQQKKRQQNVGLGGGVRVRKDGVIEIELE